MVATITKNQNQKLKFIFVGLVNTAIDFALLFVLTGLGLGRILSNMISTGVAFSFSFVANRNFTFAVRSGNVKKQFALFFVVTFFGLWVIQPIIISLVPNLLFGKMVATTVTMIWNYILYDKVVFAKKGLPGEK